MGFGLLIDSLILIGLIKLICREQTPDFSDVCWSVGGMMLIHFLLAIFLLPVLGGFVLIPMLIIDSIWLSYMLHLSASSGAMLIMSFFSAKIGLSFMLG